MLEHPVFGYLVSSCPLSIDIHGVAIKIQWQAVYHALAMGRQPRIHVCDLAATGPPLGAPSFFHALMFMVGMVRSTKKNSSRFLDLSKAAARRGPSRVCTKATSRMRCFTDAETAQRPPSPTRLPRKEVAGPLLPSYAGQGREQRPGRQMSKNITNIKFSAFK